MGYVFGADCIKIMVSMATDSSHRLKMGTIKTQIFFKNPKGPELLYFVYSNV